MKQKRLNAIHWTGIVFATIFAIIFALNVAFIPHAVEHSGREPRFVFNADNISSWREDKQGFSIELTDKGKRDLSILTHDYLNDIVSLYIGGKLVAAPRIYDAIENGNVFIVVSQEEHSLIASLLPQGKKEDDNKK